MVLVIDEPLLTIIGANPSTRLRPIGSAEATFRRLTFSLRLSVSASFMLAALRVLLSDQSSRAIHSPQVGPTSGPALVVRRTTPVPVDDIR